MTDLRDARSATEGAEPALREHQPAASVVSACLAAQARTPRRSRLSRLFGASPLNDESRKWYRGAVTELHVADELAKLGPEWVVLHGVPVGERGQTIEHLLIGPAGVFTVGLLRSHDGEIEVRGEQLCVNGSPRTNIWTSRDRATDASVRLTRAAGRNVPVRGLLVVIGARSLSVHHEPDDVAVSGVRTLHRRLAGMPGRLDRAQISAIADAAAAGSTWACDVVRHRVPTFDSAALEGLRIDVQRAWAARGFWGAAVVAAATVAALQLLAA